MRCHRTALVGFAALLSLPSCGDDSSSSAPIADAASSSDASAGSAKTDLGATYETESWLWPDGNRPDAEPIADGGSSTKDAASVLQPDGQAADLVGASLSDTLLRDVATPGIEAGNAGPDGASGDGGCTGWNALERISPLEAQNLIATSNPIVINVHIPYEGDIPGTDTSIPYTDVDKIEDYLNHDHCADVLLVCKSSGMSVEAGNELVRRGYLRVRELRGGMMAWVAAGLSLLRDGGT